MSGGIFVSAIGTDSGKTHVSAAILRELVARGERPAALKPLMSGFDPANLADSDAGRLLAAMGKDVTADSVASVCWKSFPQWLAPNVAARQSGGALDWDELLRFIHDRRPATGPFIVEGAGGVMSPLTDTHTNLDLMVELGLPVLLVATNYLGAVSHTLTALDVMQRRGLNVRAIVVSEPAPDPDGVLHLVDELARWTALRISAAAYAPTPQDARIWAGPLASRLFA